MAAPRRVVIDDSDKNIQYTGSWVQEPPGSYDTYGNFGPTYMHTVHSTRGRGTLTFPFNGTSIDVFGTTHVQGSPTWDCYVDGVKIDATEPFLARENNWSLCQKSVIADGEHELTINVTSTGSTFAFDYLQYTPSSSARLDSAIVKVDRTDPALEFSDSGWEEIGGRKATNKPGSRVKFSFTGRSLSWVGYVPVELGKAPATGTYTIDGGTPVSFKLDGLDEKATSSVYFQTFLTTGDLTSGPHSIMVTHNGNQTQTPLTMDYLLVTNSSSLEPTPPATQPSQAAPVEKTSGPPIGGVIGGILVAIVLVAAILAFFLRRRNRQRQEPYDLSEPETLDPRVYKTTLYTEPYAPSMQQTTTAVQNLPVPSRHYAPSIAASSDVGSAYHSTASFDVSSTAFLMPGYSKSSRVVAKQQEASAATQETSPTHVRLHQDSGIRIHALANDAEELPPSYTVE